MGYRLTRRAEQDVIEIYIYGAREFGAAQADAYHDKLETAFDLLASQPYIARERNELAPPVRIHPVGAHIVVYLVDDTGDILIVRVRHGREDWVDEPTH